MTTLASGHANRLKLPLDHMQRAAAEAPAQPLIVIGGPGSGKTQTLVGRIHTLLAGGAYPSTISYLTFSSRAAELTRKEIDQTTDDPEVAKRLFIGTFHSYASAFLRQIGASRLGRSPQYSLWDHDQAKEAISSMLNALAEARDEDEEDGLESRHPILPKMTGTEIHDFLQWHGLNRALWHQPPPPAEASHWHQLIELYNQEKLRQNAMDLDDLIPMAVEALERSPQLRTSFAQVRSKHLLVDEFQDITPIQYRLMQLVAGPERSITVATDPNQAIYSWRGADTRMLDQFRMDNTNAEVQMLRINHRSSKTLVDLAEALTDDETMTGLINAYQQPIRPAGPTPILLNYEGNGDALCRLAVEEAKALVATGQYDWQDIAMIYRKRDAKNQLLGVLLRDHIPFHILGDVRSTGQNATQRIVNLIACLLNPMDRAAFTNAATVEGSDSGRGLNTQTTNRIEHIAREKGINLIEATKEYLPNLKAKNRTRTNLEYIVRSWHLLTEQLANDDIAIADFCKSVIEVVQRQQVEKLEEGVNEATTQFMTIVRGSQRLYQETLRQHLTRLLETIRAGAYPDLQDHSSDNPLEQHRGLTLSTIHTAKGLQWPVVWVMDATEAAMPGRANRENRKEMEEEQRIFYVAATRASDVLILCNPTLNRQGNTQSLTPFAQGIRHLLNERDESSKPR